VTDGNESFFFLRPVGFDFDEGVVEDRGCFFKVDAVFFDVALIFFPVVFKDHPPSVLLSVYTDIN
jgi:hypothetical protein